MPTPLGHALGGIAAGLLANGKPDHAAPSGWTARPLVLATLFAALACAPDLDLLVGNHSGPTHSVGAAAMAGVVVLAWTRQPRLALAAAAAYASHIAFDWFNQDDSPPLGVMALWPFSREHFMSPVPLLLPVSRRYWLPGFWLHTLKVATVELVIFGGLAGVAVWRQQRRRYERLRR